MITRAGLAAVVAVVALFGCTNDEPSTAPTTLPSVTATPSASATPSDTAAPLPTPPAEASAHTPDGAAAFVRFYIDLINDAYATGASEPLRAYGANDCTTCTRTAKTVEDIFAGGGRAVGGLLTINTLTPTGVAEGVQTSVVVDSTASAFQELDPSGEVEAESPAESRILIFDVHWTGRSWLIEGVRLTESPA